MILITNFKTYEESLWEKWINLAKIHKEIWEKTWKNIAIAWNPLDLRILLETWIKVFSQWADLAEYGSFTWKILPIKLQKLWCWWVVLNHSENKIWDFEKLEKITKRCKELWMQVVLCADNLEEIKKIKDFWADFIAIEPPELIWWDISVSKANPEIISDSLKIVWKWKLIVWAWIKDWEDIKIAKDLWASWILLASWIIKAENPRKILEELVSFL